MGEKEQYNNNPGKFRQLVAALAVNLSALAYGMTIGWQSPVVPQLQSDNTPVGTAPMTDEAASWLNGVMCISGTVVTVFIGFGSEKISRKITGCVTAIPLCLSWLLIIFATEHLHLFLGRLFGGVGGAVVLFLVPLYVSEISSDEIRGMLGSLLIFTFNMGILLSYVFGAVLSFRMFAVVSLAFPILYLALFIFMPESPVYLIRQNKLHEAARSLLWLRAGHRPTVEQDIARIQSELKEASTTNSIGISDLFRDRGTIKALIITVGLFIGQQLCGIFAMMSYTASIFELAGSSLSPNISAITIGAIQVAGSYLSTSLMERVGRKPLILISCVGMALCHYILGTFCYLQNKNYDVTYLGWIPVVSLSMFVISYCLGMGPGPYVVTSEIFCRDVSGLGTIIGLLFVWGMAFVVGKFFPTIVAAIGIDYCFLLLGTFCVSTFCFTFFLVPETKGRPRQDILDELNGVSSSMRNSVDNIYVPAKGAVDNIMHPAQQV